MASPAGPPTTLWLACLVLPAILAPRAYAATIRVPADQPTIQAGIDAAQSGDVVLVAAGAYTGSHNKNLDFRSKDIAVRGESGPEVTTIDCEGNGRGFFLLGPLTPAATIDGLTIMNGDAAGGEAVGGGAMFIAGGGQPSRTAISCTTPPSGCCRTVAAAPSPCTMRVPQSTAASSSRMQFPDRAPSGVRLPFTNRMVFPLAIVVSSATWSP